MSSSTPDFPHKLGTAITSEPKKTIALAASTAKSGTSGKKIDLGPSGPRPNSAAAAMQKWADAPVPPVSRNLFAIRTEYFPMDGSRTQKFDTSEEGFWSRLEKSLASQADQRFKNDNLKANYMAQASELKLQSIVMGPQPNAMVNGQLVGEGSVVAGFRVLKIEARRMIIEREGIRLEIQMK
jgi:hypothetical protein